MVRFLLTILFVTLTFIAIKKMLHKTLFKDAYVDISTTS